MRIEIGQQRAGQHEAKGEHQLIGVEKRLRQPLHHKHTHNTPPQSELAIPAIAGERHPKATQQGHHQWQHSHQEANARDPACIVVNIEHEIVRCKSVGSSARSKPQPHARLAIVIGVLNQTPTPWGITQVLQEAAYKPPALITQLATAYRQAEHRSSQPSQQPTQ
jgi:hypothetical protein